MKQSKPRKKCRSMTALCVKVQCFTAKSESLHQAFGTSEVSMDKLLRRIGTIKNANMWESFVATLGGTNAGRRANASIRVQPTTMCRTNKIYNIHIFTIPRWSPPIPWISTEMNCYSSHNYKQHSPLATIVVVTSLITLYYYLKISYSRFLILNTELK
jgi:hypothetical protein